MGAPQLRSQSLTPAQKAAMYNVMFAEVGGGPQDEAHAVASTFLNNVDQKGFDKAIRMSSAYTGQSPQYKRAASGQFSDNPFETKAYLRNKAIVDAQIDTPQSRQPWTNFENVNQYGEPNWAKGAVQQKDIGRQRFYILPQNPRANAVQGDN